MMTGSRNNRPERHAFYVVQFIELPFEGIDDYVCVPYTWLVVHRKTDNKACVAYPRDEDPFITRDRANRKERYDDEWRFYMAAVKYKSDSYRDAEYWVATRNDYGPLAQEESTITYPQPKQPQPQPPRFTLNKKLRSANQSQSSQFNNNSMETLPINQLAVSEPKKQLPGKRLKLVEGAESSRAVVNNANAKPVCSKMEESIIIQDCTSMECARTEETAASNGESSSSRRSSKPELVQEPQNSMAPSRQMTYNDQALNNEPTYHLNSLKMADNLYSHMNGARRLVPIQEPVNKKIRLMSIARKLDIAAQDPSNLMDQTESTSSHSVEGQSSVVTQNQSQDGQEEIQHVPQIMVDTAAVDPRNDHQSITDVASASQNLSSPTYQRPNFVRRLDEQQRSPIQEPYLTPSHQSQYLPTNQHSIEQDLRGSTENNNYDHRPNSRTISIRIPSIRQDSTNSSNQMYQTPGLPQHRQSQPNQQDSQKQSRRPKIRVGISIKPKNNKQIPTLQGVTKKTPPLILTKDLNSIRQALLTTHNTYLRNEQRLQSGPSVLLNESNLNVMDVACQTDNRMVEAPLFSRHGVTSYADADTYHAVILDREMSTDEAPVETANNVSYTGNASGSYPADRPMPAQNATSPNHVRSRVVLEQQMLDNFATLFTQMGSTLRYTCDMYQNLRSSILETAETYRTLLDKVEKFNAMGNSDSDASSQ